MDRKDSNNDRNTFQSLSDMSMANEDLGSVRDRIPMLTPNIGKMDSGHLGRSHVTHMHTSKEPALCFAPLTLRQNLSH